MRAMLHLGFSGLFKLLYRIAGSSKEYRAGDNGSTVRSGRATPRARNSLSKFHRPRTNRLHASQNAAALLFDLGTVDIR
jgi:hypothetical protein